MTVSTGSSLEHAIGAEGLVAIHLRDGEITLQGVEGDTVRVRDVNGKDLSEMFAIEAAEGSLSLQTGPGFEFILGPRSFRRGSRRHSPELRVEVPRRATLSVATESGEIEATNMVGDQRYHTASGDIQLRSVAGQISIEVVSGDIELTSNGAASLTLRSVSGDVEVRADTLTAIEAQTTSGDLEVTARLAGPGPFTIETVSGDAVIAPAGPVKVEMATVTGDLTSDVNGAQLTEKGNRSITIGSGGPTLTFRSMSGDLHVRRTATIDQAPNAVRPPTPPTPPTPPAVPTPPGPPSVSGESRRPGESTADQPSNGAIAAAYEEARLRILRSLERGEIDVAEAGRRLETLDAGDPDAPAEPGQLQASPGEADRTDG